MQGGGERIFIRQVASPGSQGRGLMNSELVSVAAGAGPMLLFLPGGAVLFRGSDFGEINGYHFIAKAGGFIL